MGPKTSFSTKMLYIDLLQYRSYLADMPLTPEQCRAARALLDWTQDDLAARAEVSRSTVRGFEGGQHGLQRAMAAAIRRALELAGVIFLDPNADCGPGVRLGRSARTEDD
jgi:transcriptional regulator with XRE-family HTH domain